MSGHSKWSKVKHQKAVTDVAKSAAFTKASHAITIAVKEGGGMTDPASNFRLRLAIEKARAVNMPKENIQRAIDHAAAAGNLEQIAYEGYGPGGVAMIIEATTDNRARTGPQIKNLLERAGGSLASPGAVNFLFRRVGVMTVPKNAITFDKLLEAAIAAGADDVVEAGDMYEVYTADHTLASVKQALETGGVIIDNAMLIMHPTTTMEAGDDIRAKIDDLVAALEELDDVQTVFTNMS